MDRSKRAIKTPKRFDDEAFVTPPKPKATQIEAPVASKSAAKLTPTPTKNIIKVKLKSTPASAPKISLPALTPKLAPAATPKQGPANTPKQTTTAATTSTSTTLSQDSKKDIIKVKLAPKITPKVAPKVTPKVIPKATPKPAPKPTPKPKPKLQVKTPREIQNHDSNSTSNSISNVSTTTSNIHNHVTTPTTIVTSSTKMKRPKTPPVYVDLIPNVVLPFWDARTAAEDHEDDNVKELVHCHCGIDEELGLMIQCETCLTWQHAHCLGYEKPEEVPDGYTCRACSDPKFVRNSMKWAFDQDWLTRGRMKQFSLDNITSNLATQIERNANTLEQINKLIGNVLNIEKVIHSLKVKRRILQSAEDDDPELKAFVFQWPASYQHSDGSNFVPTINHVAHSPASTISVMAETPDPSDLGVENVADATLPDIGQLDDVSAILDAPYNDCHNNSVQPMITNSNNELIAPTNDCRLNLKLHIQQTEEFIGLELANIQEQVNLLEKEYAQIMALNEPSPPSVPNGSAIINSGTNGTTDSLNVNGGSNHTNTNTNKRKNVTISLGTLKSDLHTMLKYVLQKKGER